MRSTPPKSSTSSSAAGRSSLADVYRNLILMAMMFAYRHAFARNDRELVCANLPAKWRPPVRSSSHAAPMATASCRTMRYPKALRRGLADIDQDGYGASHGRIHTKRTEVVSRWAGHEKWVLGGTGVNAEEASKRNDTQPDSPYSGFCVIKSYLFRNTPNNHPFPALPPPPSDPQPAHPWPSCRPSGRPRDQCAGRIA